MPAKLLNGVMPHGKNRCQLQLLFFCLIVTDLHSPVVVLIYSVDAIPLRFPVGPLQMQPVLDSIIYGFLFQNPVQSPMPSISHSTEFWIMLLVFLFPMLPMVPVLIPGAWYPSTVFADYKLSLSSGWCKSPLESCRLSQSVTASFSMDCWSVLCNTHAVAWINLTGSAVTASS